MDSKRPVVVLVGAGFGGLATVNALKNENVDIVLIDQRNHHLFQPLLYLRFFKVIVFIDLQRRLWL